MSISVVACGFMFLAVVFIIYDFFLNDEYKHDLPDIRDVNPYHQDMEDD